MNYKRKLILSMLIAATLEGMTLQAGDIEKNLGAPGDAFTVNQPASTELIRVGGDGNVGIATASPSEKIDINGKVRVRNTIGVQTTNTIVSIDSAGVVRKTNITVQNLLDLLNQNTQ